MRACPRRHRPAAVQAQDSSRTGFGQRVRGCGNPQPCIFFYVCEGQRSMRSCVFRSDQARAAHVGLSARFLATRPTRDLQLRFLCLTAESLDGRPFRTSAGIRSFTHGQLPPRPRRRNSIPFAAADHLRGEQYHTTFAGKRRNSIPHSIAVIAARRHERASDDSFVVRFCVCLRLLDEARVYGQRALCRAGYD